MLDFLGKVAPVIGSAIGGLFGQSQQDKNAKLQREFAQSGIQWRVADAKKAGIHPLYALGAPTISPSVSAFSPMGAAASAMGQDIGRALMATKSQSERDSAVGGAVEALSLERAGLQNELLRTQIARLKGQIGPPIPTDGVGSGDFVVPEKPTSEQRPPLMMGGRRWVTSPNTSPMKAWEDQYGDEGPVASTLPIFLLYEDIKANYGQPATWPKSIVSWFLDQAKSEFQFGGNPRVSKPLGRR